MVILNPKKMRIKKERRNKTHGIADDIQSEIYKNIVKLNLGSLLATSSAVFPHQLFRG